MNEEWPSMVDSEIRKQVRYVERFFGVQRLDQALKKYRRCIEGSPGVITTENFIKRNNKFISHYDEYKRLVSKGKTIKSMPARMIHELAKLTLTINRVTREMQEGIAKEFRERLLSINNDNAPAAFFKLSNAIHMMTMKYDIEWISREGKKAEFIAQKRHQVFEFECKSINVDKIKKVKYQPFCMLSDMFLPKINLDEFSGLVELVVEDDIPSSNEEAQHLARMILNCISSDSNFEKDGIQINLKNLVIKKMPK